MNTVSEPPRAEATSLELLFHQFEERYRQETSDVRTLSCGMQEVMHLTGSVLDELDNRPLWKRIWHRLTGHAYRLEVLNSRNQLKLQHTSLLLIAAIARQNQMVMKGLELTLQKLQQVEQDARYLRTVIAQAEERKHQRRQRWLPVTQGLQRAWSWMRGLFG